MPSAALLIALESIAAGLAVLRQRTPGTPPGDVDEEHEGNTFDLPAGAPIRKKVKAFARRQLRKILGTLPEIGAPLPDAFPPLAAWDDPMASAMTPLISAYWDEAGKTTRARLGLDPAAWEVHDPHLHAKVKAASLSFCASTNATTDRDLALALADLRQEFTQGLVDRGESIPELAARVRKVFKGLSESRAETIARTEAARAVHAAGLESAKESGVVAGKHWLASAGSCDRCRDVARKVNESHPGGLPLDQPFAVEPAGNPAYATTDHPPLHPSCRCSITFVLTPEYAGELAEHGAENPAGIRPGPLGPDPAMFALPIRNPVGPTPAEPIPDYLPTDAELETPPKPPKKPAKPREAPFPGDPDTLEVVKALGGSTGAKLVRDPRTGREYVLKRGANAGHLREEAAADALYRAMGLGVPRSKVYDTAAGPVKLAEFHAGVTLGELKRTDPAAYDRAREELRKGFVADCLLGNWDVIGTNADNVLVTPDGTVIRIDNGGSLRYRAQGGIKSPSQWNGVVGELASMRNPAINGAAASVFQGITEDEVKAQAKALYRKRAAILKAAPAELRAVLEQRLAYLKDYGKPAKPVKVGSWRPTPESEFFRPATLQEAQDWGKSHYKDWGKSLDDREKRAIAFYTGSGYHSLNTWHRNPGSPASSQQLQETSEALDRALSKHPAPAGIIAYRQVSLSALGRTRASLKPGEDLGDPGFTSTTLKPGGVWSGDKFEVRIPKGTPGAWVNAAGGSSQHPSENEYLLGREADTLRIVEVRPDVIVVEVVRPAPKAAKGKPKP